MKKLIFLLILASLACMTPTLAAVQQPESVMDNARQMTYFVSQAYSVDYATVVHSGGLNVRECAGTKCKRIGLLQDGDIVTLTNDKCVIPDGGVFEWCKISEPISGYVNMKYILESE